MTKAVHKPLSFDETLPTDPGIFAELAAKQEQDKERKLEEKRLDNALSSVLSTESGKRVLRWILDLSGVEESCTSTDAMQMMALSARRDLGLQIKARVRSAGLTEHLKDEDI